jgi:hypothetical protein
VAEEDGQDCFGEVLHFLHDEALPVLGPTDDVEELVVLRGTGSTSRIS